MSESLLTTETVHNAPDWSAVQEDQDEGWPVPRRRRVASSGGGPSGAVRVPGATYRFQFNHLFTFKDALRLVSYLDDLGITDLYASPFLKAGPDSLHGYDVSNHNEIN